MRAARRFPEQLPAKLGADGVYESKSNSQIAGEQEPDSASVVRLDFDRHPVNRLRLCPTPGNHLQPRHWLPGGGQ